MINEPPVRQLTQVGREKGVVLFIVLIVLVAMMLAGAGLMRAVDTGTVIAGNFAFKQSTIQAVDAGIESAFNATFVRHSANTTAATINNQYYSTIRTLDADGSPSGVTWASAPSVDLSAANGNIVQYVVERMCAPNVAGSAPATEADIEEFCVTEAGEDAPCKRRGGCPQFGSELKVNYRVTLRVVGPRNTVTMAQTIIAF